MGRWEPDSRGRLEQAALELFAERGFDNTTVAEIAARAGVTERTFFRHYVDKREVLFWGGSILQALMVDALVAAPPDTAPLDAVAQALEAGCVLFQSRREQSRRRQAIIAASAELRERELIKLANLGQALAEALRARGVSGPAASLTAEAGMAVFRLSFARWAAEDDQGDLLPLLRESMAELRAVTSAG